MDPHFLNVPRAGSEWSASRLARYSPGDEVPGTHSIGDWVDPRTGLDDVEERKFLTLPGLKLRHLRCPTIASRYTDYVIPAALFFSIAVIIWNLMCH
jgi:hypothetical protein